MPTMLTTPSTPTKKTYMEEYELLRLLKTPKKEPIDEEEYKEEPAPYQMSVMEQMCADAEANPHVDRDEIFLRNLCGPKFQPYLVYPFKPRKFKELRGLTAAKTAGALSSALPVTGQRQRKRTWKVEEASRQGQEAPSTSRASEPAPKRAKVSKQKAVVKETARVPKPAPKKAQASTPKKAKTKTPKPIYTCPECQKPAKSGTCFCAGCAQWVHLKCAQIKQKEWSPAFRCSKCS